MSSPAERLLALAEEEHRALAEQRFEDLEALHAERERLIAALPARVGADQAPLLARAHALLQQATALAAGARAELSAELHRLDLGRAAVQGYVPAGLRVAPNVDRRA